MCDVDFTKKIQRGGVSSQREVDCDIESTTTATCTTEGITTYTATCYYGGTICSDKKTVEVSALGHQWRTSYSSDETKHWRECTREGCTAKENEEEHSFETVVDVEASCENKGSQHEECTTCHYKKTSVEISATGHALEKVAKKNASCTEAGYEAYWKCKTCGKLFSDEAGTAAIEKPVEISATGHTWKDGKCTVCGEKQPVTKENTSSSKTGKNTSSPKTGDTQEIVYIWMTLLVSVAGLTGVILKRKSER